MKILILHASVGTGHKKAAEAIHQALLTKPNVESILIDALDYANPAFRNLYSKGYDFLVKNAKLIWAAVYDFTDIRHVSKVNKRLSSLFTELNTRQLLNHIKLYEPDIIVSTHFIIAELAKKLDKSFIKKPRIVCVVTDYCVHSFWINKFIDTYIVPTQEAKLKLINAGIASSSIKIIGIPVSAKFYKRKNRQKLCRKISIAPDAFTALVVTGSVGIGPIEQIVNALKNDVQLLVICGRNRRLYLRLKKTAESQTCKVFELVDNMDELMAISDIIITKPGGLTVSESLAANLPMIFIAAIPGQEYENARVMHDFGVGFRPGTIRRLHKQVIQLKNNPDKLKEIKTKIRFLGFKGVTERIINEICKDSC